MATVDSNIAANTAPAPPRIDRRLHKDIALLRKALGDVVLEHSGSDLVDCIQRIRREARARRRSPDPSIAGLCHIVKRMDLPALGDLVRALTCSFDLTNIAEDRQRIRVLREREKKLHPAPRPESIRAAVADLAAGGLSPAGMQELMSRLHIEPVFTAHPTEAKRRTIRNILGRLREVLEELHHRDLLPRERRCLVRKISSEIACLWGTDSLRDARPTVLDEVQRTMVAADSAWKIAPDLLTDLRTALAQSYPGLALNPPNFLKFSTWVGGDRDGNPFVTPDVTRKTVQMLRALAIDHHLQACGKLYEVLTLSQIYSPVSDRLVEAIESAVNRWPAAAEALAPINPNARYRHWLAIIALRLRATLNRAWPADANDLAYPSASELRNDVTLMRDSLLAGGHRTLAEDDVQAWLDRIETFGFSILRLDVRDDSQQLRNAVLQLCAQMELVKNPDSLAEDQWQALLSSPISGQSARMIRPANLDDAARSVFEMFVLLQEIDACCGPEAAGCLIISMTHRPSDALCMLWLNRAAAAWLNRAKPAPLPIVPLFETIDDLRRARTILDALLRIEAYRNHLRLAGGRQICMIGYSDSVKDGGYLSANWSLYDAQRQLVACGKTHGIEIMFFHGRGGSIGRGGGPAARGVLALPPGSVAGRLRVTEQGEIVAERYDDPQIAYRHLEQLTWATILATMRNEPPPVERWEHLIQQAADASFQCYRSLLGEEGFVEFFRCATPIATIESLPIGSRPSRRRSRQDLADMRAIPYTFAWTQNRQILTGFFGLGTGLLTATAGDITPLREMYARWPFFRALISNAELALVRYDGVIAAAYAELADAPLGRHFWATVDQEYHRTRDLMLAITQQPDLLSHTPWFQAIIALRMPDVDVLNVVQIELIRRQRSLQENLTPQARHDAEQMEKILRQTVQGIAAGMRSTG